MFGALFVGVSVIGLTLQLRQNTHMMRAQALKTALGVHVTQIAQLTQTATAAQLFRKFVGGFRCLYWTSAE